MERCPRCSKVVEANWAYCPVCYRSRILESLQVPVVRPAWQRQVLLGLIALASLWLVITVGVAFLREAKAVRVSRVLLSEGKAQEAWGILEPFLAEHQEHRQGVFLSGKATIRLGLKDEPKWCLQQLDQLSPELAKELRADYGQILTEQSRDLSCDSEVFKSQLAWGDQLGQEFSENVIAGLDGVVEACGTAQNDRELSRIAEVLKERGKAMSMVERGYLPAIKRAVAGGSYQKAESLARLVTRQVPEGEELVDGALREERQKVTATVQTLRRLRDSLASDSSYRLGYYWCFPPTEPAAIQAARDGWGQDVHYQPLDDAYASEDRGNCHHGFAVVSSRSSETELSCRFWYGQEHCEEPGRFWRRED